MFPKTISGLIGPLENTFGLPAARFCAVAVLRIACGIGGPVMENGVELLELWPPAFATVVSVNWPVGMVSVVVIPMKFTFIPGLKVVFTGASKPNSGIW